LGLSNDGVMGRGSSAILDGAKAPEVRGGEDLQIMTYRNTLWFLSNGFIRKPNVKILALA